MKIVHITSIYIEGWGYQENLLPLYQKWAGNDVVVVTDNNHLGYINNPDLAKEIVRTGGEYVQPEGIKVYKIKTFVNTATTSFFCRGLYKILEREKPEMIFHHNVNVSTLTVAARYKRRHPGVKLYVDNHVDWINETKNQVWHWLFYDFFIPAQVHRLGSVVDKYIGVTPLRCQYLQEVFKVPQNRVAFLPIGCDTNQAEQVKANREELKRTFNILTEAFVIVSGGKISRSKGTLELIKACDKMREVGENIRLVLFGKIDEGVSSIAQKYEWITQIGWCNRLETLSLLKMADVACWPWLHTTLIEDAVAVGTPLVVKMSDNVSHFAQAKAGVFMEEGNCEELEKSLIKVKDNYSLFCHHVIATQRKYSYATLVENLRNEEWIEMMNCKTLKE